MAKAVAKSKKMAAKSKPSTPVRGKAAPVTPTSKAKKKGPAKPAAKAAPQVAAPKAAAKPSTVKPSTVKPSAVKPSAVKPSAAKPAGRSAAAAVKPGKWVFTFGDGKAEGKAELRDLLGGKGANLAEMANLGLPVPPGFTIPT